MTSEFIDGRFSCEITGKTFSTTHRINPEISYQVEEIAKAASLTMQFCDTFVGKTCPEDCPVRIVRKKAEEILGK